MLPRIASFCLLLAAFVLAPATAASADPYPPKLPTRTHITVTVQGPGRPIIIQVSASANYPTPPAGRIDVQVSKGGGARRAAAAPVFTTSVHFTDQPVRIEGPRLPKGSYVGAAQLSPDNSELFLPSEDRTGFRVGPGAAAAGEAGDAGGVGQAGGLPNTGGPDLGWLVLGAGLVVAGAGGVGYGRRRSAVA